MTEPQTCNSLEDADFRVELESLAFAVVLPVIVFTLLSATRRTGRVHAMLLAVHVILQIPITAHVLKDVCDSARDGEPPTRRYTVVNVVLTVTHEMTVRLYPTFIATWASSDSVIMLYDVVFSIVVATLLYRWRLTIPPMTVYTGVPVSSPMAQQPNPQLRPNKARQSTRGGSDPQRRDQPTGLVISDIHGNGWIVNDNRIMPAAAQTVREVNPATTKYNWSDSDGE